MSHTPCIFLVDNGSLAPASCLSLRKIASELSTVSGQRIEPISLLHSNRIDPQLLEGTPSEILEPTIIKRYDMGVREFILVPLFFGPSLAVTEYIPERIKILKKSRHDLYVRLGPPLFNQDDLRLCELLANMILKVSKHSKHVLLVDHGSPAPEVTKVRDALASQLRLHLGSQFHITACSMERRAEPKYDFTEPLLENVLLRPEYKNEKVTIAMQFLLPGRHAGPTGDVATICSHAEKNQPGLKTYMTGLVGEQPKLLPILIDRLKSSFLAPSL